ncbi:MAG: DEAD/DEAH box helicase [Atopobiaceae bacterium]|nr:DEAD/DEAH box helicase [Atopobiaceae bacterium]
MDNAFAELGLNEQILAGVESLGFTQPTPVQEQAIPLVLEGRDLVASAQTGTGKTAAFALPTLQRIMGITLDEPPAQPQEPVAEAQTEAAQAEEAPKPRRRRRRRRGKGGAEASAPVASGEPARPLALVVTPTRELAQQIERVVTTVCQHTGQRSVIVMGGAKFDRQLKALARGCDLLVATPGRLIDLMEHRHVDLGQVRILVLDEADRMLDMGFWPSVRRIVQALPKKRQNLLFSATIPPSIKGTIDAMLTDPATVEIARVGETADTVEEHLCPVTQGQKTQLLQALVQTGGAEPGTTPERVLVFCRTKHRVDDVSKTLKGAGLKVEVMHADRPQKARDKALERFREGQVQLLVATDVMSRGIDVSGIDAVVNFDVPMDPEDYVHRIGRTGRAGATGHAYTFVAPDEISPLREIEYFTKKLVPVWDLPGFAYDDARIVPNPSRSTSKPTRTMFSGSKSRRGFGGPNSGRFGRHY